MRLKRAQEAQLLLSNDVLREAVWKEREHIIDQMLKVSLADKDSHTRLIMALQMSQAVNRNLWIVIQDGHQAAQNIQLRGSRID